MAKYIPTDTFGPFSGSTGSITYSRNKGGHYRKLKSNPTNPQTSYQMFQRALLGGFAGLWTSLLTDAQRLAWNAETINYPYTDSQGHTYFLSGLDLFTALGINALTISAIPNFTPPVFQPAGAPLTLTPVVVGSTSVTIDLTAIQSAPNPSDFQIWGTPGFSQGIYNYKKKLRSFTVIPDAAIFPVDVSAAYILRFGSVPPTNSKLGFGLTLINQGSFKSSVRLTTSTIAT